MNAKIVILSLILVCTATAQQNPQSDSRRVIRYSGELSTGDLRDSAVIEFALFAEEHGGSAVWTEAQTVSVTNGKFTVLFGSVDPDGLPIAIFASGEARWLQWQVSGEQPKPRTQLVALPYALSAANAETLAGHSIGEFILTTSTATNASATLARATRGSRAGSSSSGGTDANAANVANGIPNMLAKFSTGSSTAVSQLFDDGLNVGVGTLAPVAKLEVAGDLKISGTGNALIFPDGTRFASSAAGISAKNIEQVRYADQYSAGSLTGGIAEAYADCPATGCKIQLGADINLTSPQVITIANGKPLWLDLAGRVLKVSNPAGIGLTFTAENINTRTPITVANGTLQCAFNQPGLVGFAWRYMVNVSLQNLDVRYCSTPGSLAILWDWVQDAHMNAVGFRNNAGALRVQNASNQVSFHNVWFDSNIDPVILQDNGGITFEDCLVQSNTGTRAIQIVTTPGNNATTFRIHKCHFENNGDSTAASRNIYVAPAASQYVLGLSVEDNVFSAGAFGLLGTSFEVAGSQNVLPVTFKNNQYNGYSRGKIVTGLRAEAEVTSIGENLAAGDYGYSAGLNTHGLPGLSFAPEGARRAFQIFAGWPGNYDGYLQFWDTTSNASILNYSSSASSWIFPRTAVFNASAVFNNSQDVLGFSDGQQTQTWGVTGATGRARFDGGLRLGGSGTPLVTTEQTGSGSIVMSNGARLTNPDLGDAHASSLSLNGESLSHAPRMVYSAAIANLSVPALQARWTLDRPIVVTRFQFVINSGANTACSSPGILQISDGTSQISLTLLNGQASFDSGTLAAVFPAGANLDLKISNPAISCASVALSGNATVQYRMQ